jgi:beta-galactosidase
MRELISRLCAECGIDCRDLEQDLRLRRAGDVQFAFNYGADTLDLTVIGAPVDDKAYRLGTRHLAPHEIAAWQLAD